MPFSPNRIRSALRVLAANAEGCTTAVMLAHGFSLDVITKPVDAATAEKLAAYNLSSFTHNYWSTYG